MKVGKVDAYSKKTIDASVIKLSSLDEPKTIAACKGDICFTSLLGMVV